MADTFTGVVPILRVEHLDASLEYYRNALGFRQNWKWPGFASVSRGNATIFLCERGQGHPGTWVSIFMKEVDALYNEYQKSDARIVEPPMNFPWGHTEFLVEDLDGNVMRMSGDKTGEDSEGYESTRRAEKS